MTVWVYWVAAVAAGETVGRIVGGCCFVACGFVETGMAGAGTSNLCSGAGGVMSGTLSSGAGSGGGKWGAVARFKIWAIWI